MALEELLILDQGATWKMRLDVTDDSDLPVNLQGYSARMWVKRELADTAPVLQLSTSNGKITLAQSLGQITITVTDEESDALSGLYYYDIEVESADGEVTRVLQGRLSISAGVTR